MFLMSTFTVAKVRNFKVGGKESSRSETAVMYFSLASGRVVRKNDFDHVNATGQ